MRLFQQFVDSRGRHRVSPILFGHRIGSWRIPPIRSRITLSHEPFFDVALGFVTPKSVVLDVATGDGAFAKRAGRDDFYLIDGNPDSVARLKERFPNAQEVLLPELPFSDAFFDMIHASHIVEHLPPEVLYRFLQEADRCLKPGGYLVVSAPLLNDRFYNDLSHLRPYTPNVFTRYLVWGPHSCTTRPLVSKSYKIKSLCYAYQEKPFFDDDDTGGELPYHHCCRCAANLLYWFQRVKYSLGFRTLQKRAFTLVLQKQPESER